MKQLVEAYQKTEIVFSSPDGMSWGTVDDSTQGSVSIAGGALGLLGLEVATALVITAWNPLGQELEAHENEALQTSLITDLKNLGLMFLPVLGQEPGGGWKEESLLIPNYESLNTLEKVCLLADKYKQNAIFELTDTKKRIIGVRMPDISGEAGYRLLPMGTQGIESEAQSYI